MKRGRLILFYIAALLHSSVSKRLNTEDAPKVVRYRRNIAEYVSQGCDATVKSKLTQKEEEATLMEHNKVRAKEPDTAMEEMIWNNTLASYAQSWADKCIWEHGGVSCDLDGKKWQMGQNMWVTTKSKETFDKDGDKFKAAVEVWYHEKENFHINSNKCDDGKMCGHYTQVVWSKTLRVGCGIASCPAIKLWEKPNGEPRSGTLIVCNYQPAGNAAGKEPYAVGKPCTNCPDVAPKEGPYGYMCNKDTNFLCTECNLQEYTKCQCPLKTSDCENGAVDNKLCLCKCNPNYIWAKVGKKYKCKVDDNSCFDLKSDKTCGGHLKRKMCGSGLTEKQKQKAARFQPFLIKYCRKSCGFCGD